MHVVKEGEAMGGGTGAQGFKVMVGTFDVMVSFEGWAWIRCTVCGSSWMLSIDRILDLYAAEHLIACIEAHIVCARCKNKVSIDDVVNLIPESMIPSQDENDRSLYEEFNRIKAECGDEYHRTLQKAWDYATRRVYVGRGWPGIHLA